MSNEKNEFASEATVSLEKTTTTKPTQAEATDDTPVKKVRLRAFPIWLRIIVVTILVIAAMIVGGIVGYSVLGGGEAADVLKIETWQHIFDIMNGKE